MNGGFRTNKYEHGGSVGRGGLVSPRNFETYVDPYGTVVNLMNTKPLNLTVGGMVKWTKNSFNPLLNDLTRDNLRSLLEVGSLVIPRPIVPMVLGYVEQHGPLTVEMVTDPDQLVECIIMPQEYIIPKKYAKQIQVFLNKNGITLPIPHERLF